MIQDTMFAFLNTLRKKNIHLDYASATPISREVLRAMQPYFDEVWANPSAIYKSGVRARRAVEEARTRVARLLRIRQEGVVFTGGGTESNNHALRGLVERLHAEGRAYSDIEIVTTKIEHPSLLDVCNVLTKSGVVVHYARVDEEGLIDQGHLESLLSPQTALVTFAYVNSEIGVVQDVKRITRAVRTHNTTKSAHTLVHLDASQAPLWLSCEMDRLGINLMTLDSGKCFGPKGTGILALSHGVSIAPLLEGGGQEGGLRSGTENTPCVVGCAEALARAQAEWKTRSAAVATLRDFMIDALQREVPDTILNGSRTERVANNVNVSIPGIDTEFAIITLDHHGIAASTKSACGTNNSQGSSVVREVTGEEARATATIRFTLAHTTTKKEILRTVEVLRAHVEKTRSFQETFTHPKG